MRKTRRAPLAIVVGSIVAMAACGDAQDPPGERGGEAPAATERLAAATPDARAEAEQIFATRCAACHGPEGRGDGPGASGLDPRPRNYHDPAWQQAVTDEEIERAIVYGGAAVGKSPLMIANPDLAAKPAVVAALRDLIREFGRSD